MHNRHGACVTDYCHRYVDIPDLTEFHEFCLRSYFVLTARLVILGVSVMSFMYNN
jgi:hypothetical protein